METLEERKKAFEAKYRLDQETAFKIHARHDKLIGLWAAERMGLAGDEAAAYARGLIELGLLKSGDNAIFDKVLRDLRDHGIDITEAALHAEMDALLQAAHDSVVGERK